MERIDFLLSIASLSPALLRDPPAFATALKASDRRIRPLFPLLYEELTLKQSTEIPESLRKAFFSSEERSHLLGDMSRQLSAILEANQVNYCYIKGLDIADRYYKPRMLRPSGDIDILVSHEDAARLGAILSGLGYRLFSTRPHYHSRYEGNGVLLEVHSDIVSYKYRVLFRLDAVRTASLLEERRLSDELYLLYSCLQLFDEMGRRLFPLVDIYQILKHGINLSVWERLAACTEISFPVLYTHYYALERFGVDLFPKPLLAPFRVRDSHLRDLRNVAKDATEKRELYPLILKMAEPRTEKMLRLLFPPAYVRQSYGPEGPGSSLFHHWKRILREMFGKN
ncbi:MAG: nucleotidyltransferase family protein [Fibrobacterota bacterium]